MALISELNNITPAEAYFLMYRSTLNKEMMKLTLGDLIVKNALKIEKITKHPIPNDPAIVTYKMLKRGENYLNYIRNANESEQHFLKYFVEENNEYQLASYAKMASKELSIKKERFSKKFILNSKNLKNLINTNFITSVWDNRNTQGKALGERIEKYISQEDLKLLSAVKKGDSEIITKILGYLGGFIFLLPNFENKLIKEIRNLLKDYRNSNPDSFDSTDILWYSDWDSFDSISDSFADIDGLGGEFGGGGADGDFGGDSDSGCSSCSGCSGCGGCT